MSKTFFHETVDKKTFDNMAKQGKTWDDIKQEFKQPGWCAFPDALDGQMGCWKLVNRAVKDQNSCINCECCTAS